MQRRRQQILFFSLVSILIIFILSGCRAPKWNPADFSSSTKAGRTLQRLAEKLQPGKSTRSEIEGDTCGSWDSYFVVR